MSFVYDFFDTNQILVYFVYPLIFFLMGFGILLKNRTHSRFQLADSLRYLAYFGITHGIADWGYFFIPFQRSYLSADAVYVLQSIQNILLAISFYFLFYFGMNLLVKTLHWDRWLLWIPFFMFLLWFFSFIFLKSLLVHEQNEEWWFAVSDSWVRYLIAFPGGVVSCYGLFLQNKQFKSFGVYPMIRTLYLASISVAIYSITCGLIVSNAPSLFNSQIFFSAVGLPIEVFRGITGFFMAFFILKILKVFDIEYRIYFYQAEKEKAVEEERNRIARDLHDGMIQSIYAAGLYIEGIRHQASSTKNSEMNAIGLKLEEVIDRLNALVREIRGYIKELKIPTNKQPRLEEEIRKLMKELSVESQLDFNLQYDLDEELPLEKSVQIFYIVKEALSNILRHSQADKAFVTITRNKNKIVILIEDDGIGINSDIQKTVEGKILEADVIKQGITNMKVRAQSIGGQISIESQKGYGTKIHMSFNKEAGGKK